MSAGQGHIGLDQAVDALNQRKRAIRGTPEPESFYPGESGLRMLMVGLDVDLRQAAEVGFEAALSVLEGVTDGRDVCPMLQGLWVDGLVTGLVLAELRSRNAEVSQ